jgi:hypothetical protein
MDSTCHGGKMQKALRWVLAILLCSAAAVCAADSIGGKWQGPWYRGMTSGLMTLELNADGSGTVRFTNLETFGEAPTALVKPETKGDSIEFTAAGASHSAFSAKARLDGKLLRGSGRYEGFPVRFELQRVP